MPQQNAYVVERLGRYHGTLGAGFHILLPFVDVIRYRHSLKEQAYDIPAQVCITRDNVQVGVDGVLYLKVLNPERASYGITDYLFAISQLAQTTLRSEMGKIDLDKTFEERTNINIAGRQRARQGVGAVGRQGPPLRDQEHHAAADILAAMEKQMRAEREKRAVILTSEGTRDAAGQQRRGQEAGDDQGLRSAQAAADQRGRGSGGGHPRRRRRDGRRAASRGRDRSTPRAAARRCSCASPSSTSPSSASWPRPATRSCCPANAADVGSMIALAMKSMQAVGPDVSTPPLPPRRS